MINQLDIYGYCPGDARVDSITNRLTAVFGHFVPHSDSDQLFTAILSLIRTHTFANTTTRTKHEQPRTTTNDHELHVIQSHTKTSETLKWPSRLHCPCCCTTTCYTQRPMTRTKSTNTTTSHTCHSAASTTSTISHNYINYYY